MFVPFLPWPQQSNLIFLSACAALPQATVRCPLTLRNSKMAGGTFRHPAASGWEALPRAWPSYSEDTWDKCTNAGCGDAAGTAYQSALPGCLLLFHLNEAQMVFHCRGQSPVLSAHGLNLTSALKGIRIGPHPTPHS